MRTWLLLLSLGVGWNFRQVVARHWKDSSSCTESKPEGSSLASAMRRLPWSLSSSTTFMTPLALTSRSPSASRSPVSSLALPPFSRPCSRPLLSSLLSLPHSQILHLSFRLSPFLNLHSLLLSRLLLSHRLLLSYLLPLRHHRNPLLLQTLLPLFFLFPFFLPSPLRTLSAAHRSCGAGSMSAAFLLRLLPWLGLRSRSGSRMSDG